MAYRVEFLPEAETDLAELDSTVRERVFKKIKWLADNFENVTPEALSGEFKGYFKLRRQLDTCHSRCDNSNVGGLTSDIRRRRQIWQKTNQ